MLNITVKTQTMKKYLSIIALLISLNSYAQSDTLTLLRSWTGSKEYNLSVGDTMHLYLEFNKPMQGGQMYFDFDFADGRTVPNSSFMKAISWVAVTNTSYRAVIKIDQLAKGGQLTFVSRRSLPPKPSYYFTGTKLPNGDDVKYSEPFTLNVVPTAVESPLSNPEKEFTFYSILGTNKTTCKFTDLPSGLWFCERVKYLKN